MIFVLGEMQDGCLDHLKICFNMQCSETDYYIYINRYT